MYPLLGSYFCIYCSRLREKNHEKSRPWDPRNGGVAKDRCASGPNCNRTVQAIRVNVYRKKKESSEYPIFKKKKKKEEKSSSSIW